ncbi:MAG TPA: arginine--tRNA ligase, partial [Pirellulales bacterium]|nr:arginine--tRNA ligase [Pirellulales bacterium]
MNILSELRRRFAAALGPLAAGADLAPLVDMVRVSQDARHGDYQANCAMPLGKQLGRSPRDVAAEIVGRLDVGDLCHPPEIAGPGFINLRVFDSFLSGCLGQAVRDERLGVAPVEQPRTYVIDYSAPNVAKPMHVGHVRSTVIGASLEHTLRFLGHRVTSDNHIGDWGTQFGMIIYGYRNFLDVEAYRRKPVDELARVYRLVNQLIGYHEGQLRLIELRHQIDEHESQLNALPKPDSIADAKERKEAEKRVRKQQTVLADSRTELTGLREKLAAVD